MADMIFKGSEKFVIQTDDNWRRPDEGSNGGERGGARRGGGFGGPPGTGGPRGRSSRGARGSGNESGNAAGYSNLQNTLSRPHEEIGVIVGGATDLKVDGEKLTGSMTSPRGSVDISEGKVQGDSISFVISFNEMRIVHTGKVAGDELKMTRKMEGAEQSQSFLAKRDK